MDWRQHVTTDPDLCHGKACIRGTRIIVSVVLDKHAAGVKPEEILVEHPSLTLATIDAAIAEATDLSRERVLPLLSPRSRCGSRSMRIVSARQVTFTRKLKR
jgi:uncharacterized protein (DUF433 family)